MPRSRGRCPTSRTEQSRSLDAERNADLERARATRSAKPPRRRGAAAPTRNRQPHGDQPRATAPRRRGGAASEDAGRGTSQEARARLDRRQRKGGAVASWSRPGTWALRRPAPPAARAPRRPLAGYRGVQAPSSPRSVSRLRRSSTRAPLLRSPTSASPRPLDPRAPAAPLAGAGASASAGAGASASAGRRTGPTCRCS